MKNIEIQKNIVAKKISISQILFTPPWKGIKNEPYSHIYYSNQTMTFTHDWMRQIGRYYPFSLSLHHLFWFTRESYYFRYDRKTNVWYVYIIYMNVSLSNICPSPFRVYLRALLLKRWSNKKRVLFVWGFCLCCVLFVCVCFGGGALLVDNVCLEQNWRCNRYTNRGTRA